MDNKKYYSFVKRFERYSKELKDLAFNSDNQADSATLYDCSYLCDEIVRKMALATLTRKN